MLVTLLLMAAPVVDPEVARFWGAANLARLSSPSRIELFRVRPHDLGHSDPSPVVDAGVIGGYVVTANRGSVSVAASRRLVNTLLDRSTYSFRGGNKLCGEFHPGLAVRFIDDQAR